MQHRNWLAERVQEAMGIAWPEGVSEIHFTEGRVAHNQGWIAGHLRLPADRVEAFMSEHGFQKAEDGDLSFVFGCENLPEAYAMIMHPASFHILTGKTPHGAPFTLGLDAENGSLWFSVLIPQKPLARSR
jgi:hypothetical protein